MHRSFSTFVTPSLLILVACGAPSQRDSTPITGISTEVRVASTQGGGATCEDNVPLITYWDGWNNCNTVEEAWATVSAGSSSPYCQGILGSWGGSFGDIEYDPNSDYGHGHIANGTFAIGAISVQSVSEAIDTIWHELYHIYDPLEDDDWYAQQAAAYCRGF